MPMRSSRAVYVGGLVGCGFAIGWVDTTDEDETMLPAKEPQWTVGGEAVDLDGDGEITAAELAAAQARAHAATAEQRRQAASDTER